MYNKLIKALDLLCHDMAIYDLRMQKIHAEKYKLTYNDILYLDIISAKSGEYTVSNISDMLQVAKPSVTQKINALEKKGYIYKKQSETDKRIFFLHYNENIKDSAYEESSSKIEDILKEDLGNNYTQEDLDKFSKMLDVVSTAYRKESF